MKSIKNLRKTTNSVLLVIASDDLICQTIQERFTGSFKQILTANTNELAIETIKTNKIDIAIVDINTVGPNFKNVCFELNLKTPAIPKILLSDIINESTLIETVNCGGFMVIEKPINITHLHTSVIMCLNHNKRGDKLLFANGFYYDEYREKFFKKNGEVLDLTKLELGLLKFLISKQGEIVDYDAINKYVWKGKKMSVFTMRNVVNKVRQKTYYGIIRNYSNKGYSIDTPKNA